MKKIKVLHTLCRIGSGGVEQRRLLIAKHFPAQDYEHLLICQDISGALPAEFERLDWQIETIGNPRSILDPAWYNRALKIAKRFKPDIIHGAVYEGMALANVIGTFLPKAKVLSEETSVPVGRRRRAGILLKMLLKRSDLVLGVSPSVAKYLIDDLRLQPSRVRCVINGIEDKAPPLSESVDELRSRLSLSKDNFVVGTVSRLDDSHKNISDVIEAVNIISDVRPEIRLLIVGDGPDRLSLENKVISYGLEDKVIFAGYQGDTRPFYSLFDVFALVSTTEGLSIALIEALQSSTPCIVSDIPPNLYVVGGEHAALVVPLNEPRDIADAVLRLCVDSRKRKELEVSGRRRALTYFGVERYINDLQSVYREVLLGSG